MDREGTYLLMRPINDILREGMAHLEARRYLDAAKLFDGLLAVQPKLAIAANGLAIAHHHLGNVGTAISTFSHAVSLAQDDPDVWTNFGATLRFAGHLEWARAAYRRALEIAPDWPHALNAMAGSYVNSGDPAPGVTYGQKAVAAMGETPSVGMTCHQNLALCLMELGRWDEAWPHWRRRYLEPRAYPGERWRGEEVDWLIVHGEQGLGDEVMFLACLPELMDRAHRGVVIEVNPRLVPLVRQSFPRCTVIGKPDEFRHPGDGVIAVAALGDLPEFCAGGVPPKRGGYLKPRLFTQYSDAVLLAMRGGTMQTHDYVRNPPVDAWRPVVDAVRAAGLRPVSIQYGPDGAKMADALGVEFDKWSADDITWQAGAIASCAAVISVQQTALHLGGAVGAPVLGIVSNKPAWRYGITGEMPWYETVELYRQGADETDWAPVMGRVAEAVARLRVGVAA